jgi:hypothetical protein
MCADTGTRSMSPIMAILLNNIAQLILLQAYHYSKNNVARLDSSRAAIPGSQRAQARTGPMAEPGPTGNLA